MQVFPEGCVAKRPAPEARSLSCRRPIGKGGGTPLVAGLLLGLTCLAVHNAPLI